MRLGSQDYPGGPPLVITRKTSQIPLGFHGCPFPGNVQNTHGDFPGGGFHAPKKVGAGWEVNGRFPPTLFWSRISIFWCRGISISPDGETFLPHMGMAFIEDF